MKLLKLIIIPIFISITLQTTSTYAIAKDRLHIITVAEWSDAIILESNGRYAMDRYRGRLFIPRRIKS